MKPTEFLTGIRQIIKLHEALLKPICSRHQLSLLEASVLAFLYNNPAQDTAADLVEYRRLSKSNVSLAVESLSARGLLLRQPDKKDRRRVHLSLLPACRDITDEIDQMQLAFMQTICQGIDPEQMAVFTQVHHQIIRNIDNAVREEE